MTNNRICIVCSKQYRYCSNCAEFAHLEQWHNIFHDDNCREIYNAVSSYIGNEKTKEETKERLNKCDLSNREHFKNNINKVIDEICVFDHIVAEETVHPEEFIQLEENVIESTETEKSDSVKITYKSRKRK